MLRDLSQSAASPEGDDPTKAQGEARRVSRVVPLPWVAVAQLERESQRDDSNPIHIVHRVPFRAADKVHGTRLGTMLAGDAPAGSE